MKISTRSGSRWSWPCRSARRRRKIPDGPSWQQVRNRFRSGELTLKEYQEITFREIQADRAAMQDYVKKNANLRPYFGELWSHCRERNIPLAIVSQGA